jgi:uncharacterized membrane protein YfhO
VDGRPAIIEKAYGAFRGVVVEAGNHTVEMRYRPWSVFIGGAMTGAAALVALWMAWGKKEERNWRGVRGTGGLSHSPIPHGRGSV